MANEMVFLTGATGDAGQYVLAELVRRGMRVTALVRRPTTLAGCRSVVGELASLSRLAADITAAGAVVHLASPRSQERHAVIRHEILGTGALLDHWQQGPFVYASSPTVCAVPSAGRLNEDSPLDPANWYDLGKLTNEVQLRMAAGGSGEQRGPAVSLRPGLFLAAGERRNDRQHLSEIYSACRLGQKFLFDSEEGLETYGTSFIGGADFGRAVAEALSIKTGGVYNVAGGDFTWKALIETINKHAGTRAECVVRAGAQPQDDEFRVHQSRFYLDASKFNTATAFAPQQSLDELVHDYVEAERTDKQSAAPPPPPQRWLDQFIEPPRATAARSAA